MRCANCQHDPPDGSAFCNQCGDKLDSDDLTSADRTRLQQLLTADLTTEKGDKEYRAVVADGLLPKIKKGGLLTLKAAVKFTVLPFGAVLGAFLSGWATDRFFGGRLVFRPIPGL